MTSPIETLGELVFSGVPSNAAYDLVKLGWTRFTKKSWEELFLDAFKRAFNSEKEQLKKYARNDGEISLDLRALREVLKHKLAPSPYLGTYTAILANDFSAKLASAMADRGVLIIGGQNLPPEGYAHLVLNIVRYAREYFRLSVRDNEEAFRRMMQEVAEVNYGNTQETRRLLNDLYTYLGNQFDLIIDKLNAIYEIAEKIYDHQTGRIRPTWHRSPFPGLRRFTDREAEIFFGRDREITELIFRMETQRLVVVTGASGSGKSSLVWAGVIAKVKDRFHWIRFTPAPRGTGDNPFMALATELQPLLETKNYTTQAIAAELNARPEALDELCAIAAQSVGEILLFIDQLEELFTLVSSDFRASFIEMLACTSQFEHVRCILTVRSDFYPHCIETKLEEILRTVTYTLFVPKLGALYEMIARPALLAGFTFESGLAQRIIDDTGYEPGGLALMAYLLDELYQRSQKRGDNLLTFEDYDDLGGVQGAIAMRAEHTYAELSGKDDDKDTNMQRIFWKLVVVDEYGTATRQRCLIEQFDESEHALVTAFTNAHLLITYEGFVEVAHEALFRSWERLKDWIAKAQEDLILLRHMRTAAAMWEANNRSRDFLWLGDRGQDAEAMIARLKPDLNDTERAFARPEAEHLLDEITDIRTVHIRRSEISTRLHQLNYTLPGTGLREDGLPDILWLPVDGSNHIYEFKFGKFEVKPFYIAKYLTTYVQFEAFLDHPDGIDQNPEWWRDMPESYQNQGLVNQRQPYTNFPRDSVSWYQAVAFARWLDAQLRHANLLPDSSLQVRLPTEWEWQWAAMGGAESREVPWKGRFEHGYANTIEAGLGRPIAVGMYPHGAAVCGALDMAGNLCEWCQNERSNPSILNGFNNNNTKALRGGSFHEHEWVAATAYRHDDNPHRDSSDYGFRLIVGATIDSL